MTSTDIQELLYKTIENISKDLLNKTNYLYVVEGKITEVDNLGNGYTFEYQGEFYSGFSITGESYKIDDLVYVLFSNNKNIKKMILSKTKTFSNNDIRNTVNNFKNRITELKVEDGKIKAQIEETVTTINEDIDEAINASEESITEKYTSLIEQTANSIDLMISELKEITDGTNTTMSEISNKLEMTSEMAQFIKTTTEQLQSAVDGKVDTVTIQEWARFNGASLELGASNSPFKCILSNTELGFYQGENKVAWISNNELHVLRAVITNSIGCGNFTFVDEGEFGFSLL